MSQKKVVINIGVECCSSPLLPHFPWENHFSSRPHLNYLLSTTFFSLLTIYHTNSTNLIRYYLDNIYVINLILTK